MTDTLPTDVQQMIDEQLASGRYATEDEVLREALRALSEEEEDLVAVREAIGEWRAGDNGVPLAKAFEQVRFVLSEHHNHPMHRA